MNTRTVSLLLLASLTLSTTAHAGKGAGTAAADEAQRAAPVVAGGVTQVSVKTMQDVTYQAKEDTAVWLEQDYDGPLLNRSFNQDVNAQLSMDPLAACLHEVKLGLTYLSKAAKRPVYPQEAARFAEQLLSTGGTCKREGIVLKAVKVGNAMTIALTEKYPFKMAARTVSVNLSGAVIGAFPRHVLTQDPGATRGPAAQAPVPAGDLSENDLDLLLTLSSEQAETEIGSRGEVKTGLHYLNVAPKGQPQQLVLDPLQPCLTLMEIWAWRGYHWEEREKLLSAGEMTRLLRYLDNDRRTQYCNGLTVTVGKSPKGDLSYVIAEKTAFRPDLAPGQKARTVYMPMVEAPNIWVDHKLAVPVLK
ncbi:hypothetical protein [Deinococcus ficus]|uniref:Uncharacterized protein n=1 Tax=Deinococcus ficus TaxID=317577 RepID=A0A221T354_9DEIO|nr:hypothetical protein [Deinococcus ficus]ASN83301.1 hypothetical protein DFI_19070 [Deinococcus ficus]